MFSKRRRIPNPKQEILRGIFNDNLRIAGHYTEGGLKKCKWERWFHQARRSSLILLAAAVFSVPGLSLDRKTTQMAMVTKPFEINETKALPADAKILDSGLDPVLEPGLDLEPGPAPEPDLHPHTWNLYTADIRNSQDYSLLLSRNDHVRLSALFGLDIKKIVIDPGHGGRDPGAVGAKGTREKDIVLDVSLRLKQRLLVKGHDVLLTRETDRKLSLAQRVAFAKENKADLFISVHVNSLPDQTINIIETYFFGPPLNSEILRLAEQENKESHFTIGELDAIIQDIGNTLKRQESAMLAGFIQESLFRNVRNHDDQVLDFGIKMAPFVVLSQIEVPSVLVEISCLTKEEEEEKLASAPYREKIASFIEEGIISYLEKQDSKIIIGEIQ